MENSNPNSRENTNPNSVENSINDFIDSNDIHLSDSDFPQKDEEKDNDFEENDKENNKPNIAVEIPKRTAFNINQQINTATIEQFQCKDENLLQQRTNSSLRTIFSISNAMIVYPILFKKYGIFTCSFILFLISYISYSTAKLLIFHFKNDEFDLPPVIQRLLGFRNNKFYCISASILLSVASLVYFLLLVNMLYPIMIFIFDKIGKENLVASGTSYSKFSFQYATIIVFLLGTLMISIKNLKYILMLSQYSFIAVITFNIFVIYLAISNLVQLSNLKKENPSVEIEKINLFTTDIATIAGSCSLSFINHNMLVAVFQKNKNQKNNLRDLKCSFIIVTIVYISVGIFGSLGILNKTLLSQQANTMMDYIPKDNVFGFIIELLFFFVLFSVFPLPVFFGREQFFQIIYIGKPVPKCANYIFKICFLLCCLLLGLFNMEPALIISLNGAIFGFFTLYYFPIRIHFACLYKKLNNYKLPNTSVNESNAFNRRGSSPNSAFYSPGINNIDWIKNEKSNEMHICDHRRFEKFSKNKRYFFYGTIFLFGVAMLILQLVDLIRKSI